MVVTALTKEALRCRRIRRQLIGDGFEEIGENGGNLWELRRGGRVGQTISEVKIAPEGTSLFIKTSLQNGTNHVD